MSRYFSIRVGLVAAAMTLAASSWLAGQALKPSAAVSSLPAAQPTGANSAAEPDLRTKQVPQHLDVIYSDGKLAVDATNASLNEILLEVSKKTGIKVTGNVSDDRVFGHYGPSSPAMILDALLDGTENNFLLMGGWGDRPGGSAAGSSGNAAESGSMAGAELILTPRRGGASPPNPNASVASEDGNSENGRYVPPARPYQLPVPNGRNVAAAPIGDGTQNPSGDGTESSGPKTPQQIYDQLQRTMQRQQQSIAPAQPQ